MPRLLSRATPLLVCLATLALSCGSPKGTSDERRRLDLHPCHLEGLGQEALCGELVVFEDRAAATGRTIALNIVVVPARSAAAPDPLFLLAGGPGQSITKVGPSIVRALREVHEKRDIVLVDQRGTGGSNGLNCRSPEDPADLQRYFRSEVVDPAEIQGCLAALEADPRLYTTNIAMDDLDDVRAALGYGQINLWGASYGTRAALVYVRRHRPNVRSVVIDGVAPTTMPLPLFMARDAQRALDKLFEHCAAESYCSAAFPTLRQDLDTVLTTLESEPARIEVRHPRTGAPAHVEISREVFAGGLRGMLYDAHLSSLLPLLIHEAAAGRFDAFVAATVALSESVEESMSIGMMLSVLCAEDLPRVDAQELAQLSDATFVGTVVSDPMVQACALWPRGDVDPSYGNPVKSEVPVLLLSGELDPVTPPSWAEETANSLGDSVHVVVPGTGHGTTVLPVVAEMIAEFLSRPVPGALDTAAVDRIRRPPFFQTFAGPPP